MPVVRSYSSPASQRSREQWKWESWDGSWWRPWYYAPHGTVPATATRQDHTHQCYSEDTAFYQGRRIAIHFQPDAATGPGALVEAERRANLALQNCIQLTMPSGAPLYMPATVRHREQRRIPYFAYSDDQDRWRCGIPCNYAPKCAYLSLCGSMLGPHGEAPQGRHICSRCHAREIANVPPDKPAP